MQFLLYAHGGSYNHGAEAIVASTISLIREKYPNVCIGVSTHFMEQDMEFDIKADCFFNPDYSIWKLEKKAVTHEEKMKYARQMYKKALDWITRDTVLLSVGGDNYCYGNWHRMEVFQETAQKKGAKSILWGASIDPSLVTKDMMQVLNTYSSILVRESLTYEALKKNHIKVPVKQIPDIAFSLPLQETKEEWKGDYIGINLSPLVLRREIEKGILLQNFLEVIDKILECDKKVLLIPHVTVWADNDLEALRELYERVGEEKKERVILLEQNYSAKEYKYVVSKCKALICTRTHASIAGYSTGVPTIVVGYSCKSIGIAKDIGMSHLVIDVTKICHPHVLAQYFEKVMENGIEYSIHLKQKMLEYKSEIKEYFTYI